jgi:hypothetical protein
MFDLRGADSLKLYGLVMVGLKTLITNETNCGLRRGIRHPQEGKLLAAVLTRNAEIAATFDPLNEHWGIESNSDIGIAGGRPSECCMKRFKSASAVALQRPFYSNAIASSDVNIHTLTKHCIGHCI